MIKSWRQRLLAAGFVPLIGSLAAPGLADQGDGDKLKARSLKKGPATEASPGGSADRIRILKPAASGKKAPPEESGLTIAPAESGQRVGLQVTPAESELKATPEESGYKGAPGAVGFTPERDERGRKVAPTAVGSEPDELGHKVGPVERLVPKGKAR